MGFEFEYYLTKKISLNIGSNYSYNGYSRTINLYSDEVSLVFKEAYQQVFSTFEIKFYPFKIHSIHPIFSIGAQGSQITQSSASIQYLSTTTSENLPSTRYEKNSSGINMLDYRNAQNYGLAFGFYISQQLNDLKIYAGLKYYRQYLFFNNPDKRYQTKELIKDYYCLKISNAFHNHYKVDLDAGEYES